MGAGRDLHGRHKDGREIPVEVGLNPIDTEEGTLVLGSIIDITGRKAVEAALRAARAEAERDRRRRVLVDQQHPELAAVAGVDQPGRVDDPDAVPGGEPRAGLHEAGVPLRDGHRDAGGDHGPLPGSKRDAVTGGD